MIMVPNMKVVGRMEISMDGEEINYQMVINGKVNVSIRVLFSLFIKMY